MLKKTKNNNFMILVLALILAFLAAFVGKGAIDKHLEAVDVYKIAASSIEERTVLEDKHIMKVKVPSSEVHAEAVKDKKRLKGRAVTTKVFYGQQIIEPMLSDYEKGNDLTHNISENKRAIAIPVDIYTSLGGNIQDTDRVDIIGNFESVGEYNGNFSRVLLSNVKILKVVENAGETAMLIVETTPAEAEIIEYAKAQGGMLGISLVPYGEERTNTYGVKAKDFLHQYMPKD